MTQLVTTILVDGDNLFGEGLRRILSTTSFPVAQIVAAIDEIPLEDLGGSRRALVLMEAGDDHAVTAAAVRRLKGLNASARVVVLSDRCKLDDALAVLRAGADGYLLKQISCDALIKSLDLVMLGVTILPAAVGRLLGEADEAKDEAEPAPQASVAQMEHLPRRLSDRETAILRCLMQGESNKVIARQFEITEATVKVHIKAILRKISVRNRTQAAVWAHNHLLDSLNTRQVANGNSHMHHN